MRKMPRPRRDTTAAKAGAVGQSRGSTPSPAFPASLAGTPTCYKTLAACQAGNDDERPHFSEAILLVDFTPAHQNAIMLDHRRSRFFIADNKLVQQLSDAELEQVDFVVFDVTNITNELWLPLQRVSSLRKHNGAPVLVRSWSRHYHSFPVHRMIQRLGVEITYSLDVKAISHSIDLMRSELAELLVCGPHFAIVHRFWQRETICTSGEAIAEVCLLHRGKIIPIPLSTSLMLLFDYLARHKHLGQGAAQIAAGLSVDPFTRRHGAHAGATASLAKKVSRTAVKQQIMRLRVGLRLAFHNAGISLDPGRVLVSEVTLTNEVRYCLRASVNWQHSEF
jgi:hypothetical protein